MMESMTSTWWAMWTRRRSPSYDQLSVTDEEATSGTSSPDTPPSPTPSLIPRLPLKSSRARLCCLVLLPSLLLVFYLSYSLYSNPTSFLWPSSRLTEPLCLPLSSEYDAWVDQHRRLRQSMESNCSATWATFPRLLVHECHSVCSGLGDRVGKAAGLFALALLTNRSLFLHHTLPQMSEWYEPTESFDWTVTGKVKECLEYGRQLGFNDRFHSAPPESLSPVHEARWHNKFWGWNKGWRGWLRKALIPQLASEFHVPEEAALFIDANVNLVRPLAIIGEMRQAADAAVERGLLPYPAHTDDTFSSLLTGCLLSELWRPSGKTTQLVAPLVTRAADRCLVAVHIRFGDQFMFHFNHSTLEGSGTDSRITPQSDVVQRSLRCAVKQAHQSCSASEQAAGLTVFYTTDAPRYNGWFDDALDGLHRWDAAEYGSSSAFASIQLLKSPWEKPGSVASFGVIEAEELKDAEQQLISDWTMLSQAKVTVTTGSVFSYTAAANGRHFPIDANTCAVRWWG